MFYTIEIRVFLGMQQSQKINLHICNAGISVGFGHKKMQIFGSNSSPLGLENTLNLIKYLFLGFKKTCSLGQTLWSKSPDWEQGDKGRSVQMPVPPNPPPLQCKICDEYSQPFQT